jgi:predicted GNAT superfamily acetyltransferase
VDALTIRPIRTVPEYDACEEIQRRAWGYQDLDVVPTNELISAAKAGGVVLGAYEPAAPGDAGPTVLPRGGPAAEAPGGARAERLLGFCFGFLGRDHATGRLYHYSRMVGVDPAARRRGIALRLKHAQRDAVLAQGLDAMRWTFHPLQAQNASLNLHRLGAEAIAYVRDMYGALPPSPAHAGSGTDRLLVEWRLRGPRRAPDPGIARLAIPADLADLRRDPEAGERERLRVRDAFERAFAEGIVAVDFDPEAGGYAFARLPESAAPGAAGAPASAAPRAHPDPTRPA